MAGAAGARPALHPLTADDRGSLIIIIAYAWIFITTIVTIIRFSLAWSQRQRFKVDDVTFLVGVTFAMASTASFLLAANHGLGKRLKNVSSADLGQYYKTMYAGELLSVVAMASAKMSVLVLSDRVAPRKERFYNGMRALILFWTTFSIFAIAFQCGLPKPWVYDPDDCPTKGYVYYPIIILNIVTDGILATWILPTLWNLLMDTGKRMTVMLLFGSRLVVCCFAIVQLTSLARHIRDPDVTYEAFGRILWGLCVTHLSVLLATVPRTNRFIVALQSTHATTLLTDFELQQPHGVPQAPPKDVTFGTTEMTTKTDATTTIAHDETHSHSRDTSRVRTGSQSPSRSHRPHQPPVDAPLQLRRSSEQVSSAHIMSSSHNIPREEHRPKRNSKKFDTSDWKKYLKRGGNGDDMNVSSMFSWSSRASAAQEKAVQTREEAQEVEVAPSQAPKLVRNKPQMVRRG